LLAEHQIDIVADRGLARRVDAAVWRQIMAGMGDAFTAGHVGASQSEDVQAVDGQLRQHFPVALGAANPDELPDCPDVR
jgi:uncharacterized membrane protein